MRRHDWPDLQGKRAPPNATRLLVASSLAALTMLASGPAEARTESADLEAKGAELLSVVEALVRTCRTPRVEGKQAIQAAAAKSVPVGTSRIQNWEDLQLDRLRRSRPTDAARSGNAAALSFIKNRRQLLARTKEWKGNLRVCPQPAELDVLDDLHHRSTASAWMLAAPHQAVERVEQWRRETAVHYFEPTFSTTEFRAALGSRTTYGRLAERIPALSLLGAAEKFLAEKESLELLVGATALTGLTRQIVEGLLGYLGDRLDAELRAFMFEQFHNRLCQEDNEHRYWFRRTCAVARVSSGADGPGLKVFSHAIRLDLGYFPSRVALEFVEPEGPFDVSTSSRARLSAALDRVVDGRVEEGITDMVWLFNAGRNRSLACALDLALDLVAADGRGSRYLRHVLRAGLATAPCAAHDGGELEILQVLVNNRIDNLENLRKAEALLDHTRAPRTSTTAGPGRRNGAVAGAIFRMAAELLPHVGPTPRSGASLDRADLRSWARLFEEGARGQSHDYEAAITIAANEHERAPASPRDFAKDIGPLIALAKAESEDDVKAALESLHHPVGGWRRKAICGRWTLSISALVAVQAGGEFRHAQRGGLSGTSSDPIVGLTTPITLEVARGFGSRSLGVFATLIDPLAYLQADLSGSLPDPNLLTMLSPGLGVRFAPWRAPLNFGALFAFRPFLRSEADGVVPPPTSTFQAVLFVGLDLTLFSFGVL